MIDTECGACKAFVSLHGGVDRRVNIVSEHERLVHSPSRGGKTVWENVVAGESGSGVRPDAA